MLAPADPDPEIATALLDIATRPWPHGADATLAQLEVLRARGVPLERFEMRLGVNHPLLSSVGLQWTTENGPHYVVKVNDTWIVESREQRVCAVNPLHRDQPQTDDRTWLIDAVPIGVARRVLDVRAELPAMIALQTSGGVSALLGGIETGAPNRAIALFVPPASQAFSAADTRAIHTMTWGAAAVARATRWRVLANVIANAYIGPRSGLRVLNGDLRRGEMERRTAVIWFSCLRNFAALCDAHPPEIVAENLNTLFEVVERQIALAGGEVLKLMGDTVLAYFPYGLELEAPEAVTRALRAVGEINQRLPRGLSLGVGLHRGELAYGNVGSMERLDFTVVGSTVNEARRIQRMTARLDFPVLASAAVARCSPERWRPCDHDEAGPQAGSDALFEPR